MRLFWWSMLLHFPQTGFQVWLPKRRTIPPRLAAETFALQFSGLQSWRLKTPRLLHHDHLVTTELNLHLLSEWLLHLTFKRSTTWGQLHANVMKWQHLGVRKWISNEVMSQKQSDHDKQIAFNKIDCLQIHQTYRSNGCSKTTLVVLNWKIQSYKVKPWRKPVGFPVAPIFSLSANSVMSSKRLGNTTCSLNRVKGAFRNLRPMAPPWAKAAAHLSDWFHWQETIGSESLPSAQQAKS